MCVCVCVCYRLTMDRSPISVRESAFRAGPRYHAMWRHWGSVAMFLHRVEKNGITFLLLIFACVIYSCDARKHNRHYGNGSHAHKGGSRTRGFAVVGAEKENEFLNKGKSKLSGGLLPECAHNAWCVNFFLHKRQLNYYRGAKLCEGFARKCFTFTVQRIGLRCFRVWRDG